jgi:hypothetical protein
LQDPFGSPRQADHELPFTTRRHINGFLICCVIPPAHLYVILQAGPRM